MKTFDFFKPLLVKALVVFLSAAGGFVAAGYPAEFASFCRGL